MTKQSQRPTLGEHQAFNFAVYGQADQKHFTVDEMLTNVNRFTMRGLKGIRKGDHKKIETNLVIALSWMLSLLNSLHIDLEENLWKRFPYHCSYCGGCPCTCKASRVTKRVVSKKLSTKRRPRSIGDLQRMFMAIYPADSRTLEHAGIHLAEEVGELSEAVLKFRGNHTDLDFDAIALEAADAYSCFMGVFNSFGFDYEDNVRQFFKRGCRTCSSKPCRCTYRAVMSFKS